MSIQKRSNGYTVRWRDSSGRHCSKQVTRWRDAITLDGEMTRKKAMGELIVHEKSHIRLGDFYELWLEKYATPNLTARSRTNYEQLWKKHIASTLGSQYLCQLDRESVASLIASLHTGLAPSTTRKVMAVLQSVLQRAVEWGYLPTNPAAGIKKPRLMQREGRVLGHEDIAALLKELPDNRSRVIVGTLYETGIRPGELRALTWADIQEDRLLITKAASQNQVGPTKTNSKRSVSLNGRISDVLKRWHFAQGRTTQGLIFPGANGKLWTDQGWKMWQRKVFKPAAERAGLPGVVPYDLRHSSASLRAASGIDILTLANQLGHSPTMTLTVYGHLLGGESVREAYATQVDTA